MDESKEVRQIPIEDIIPNRFQPRINFDEKALGELSESIKQHGIIQPLVLRPLGDKFEIIAGERRYKAATLAGLSTVPGIVTEMDDNTSAEVALIENVQRKDLSAIEEAKSYKSMLERSNMTQEELAKKMGLSQSTIANKLRLLNLAPEVQNALSQEKISERHARALLSITAKAEQVKWLDRIINERLTVRQLDLAIKDELNNNDSVEDDGIPKVNINPDIESIINNSVDINTSAPVNVITPIEEDSTLNSGLDIAKPTNKFFNYLEDEEVNMNITEEPSKEENSNITTEVFNFTPEFQNAPENSFVSSSDEEIELLDVEDNVVQETVDETPIFNLSESQNNIDTSDSYVNDTPVENIEVINEPVNIENNETQVEDVQPIQISSQYIIDDNPKINEETSIQSEPEFIFDDDEYETPIVDQTPALEGVQSQENDIVIEPIPIIEGEGIVDPVSYYDTLDPNFMDKVKEYVGLDLKKAINSYRDLTSELNSKGFNVSIDETDLDGKYLIEININKE